MTKDDQLSEFKQFWITLREEDNEPTHIALFKKFEDRKQMHVIEYAAVESLLKEIEELKRFKNNIEAERMTAHIRNGFKK